MKPTIRIMEFLSAGTVQGMVSPEDSNALVTIKDSEDIIVVEGVIEAEDGNFVFGALVEGTYTYEINAEGYEKVGPEEFEIVAQEITDLELIEITPLKLTGTIDPAESGAIIRIYGQEWEEVAHEVIDEDGIFLFEALPAGIYTYVVEADGYEDLGPEEFEMLDEGTTDLGQIVITLEDQGESMD